jgi:ATP-dependent Clp protease ATP-binding subunit ClpC
MDAIIKKELKNKFSPEFLNRLDDIILFDQLKSEDIFKIVDIELEAFNKRMQEEGYTFKFNKNAKVLLSKEGYDQAYGARPIKRAIQKYVEDIVADAILEGQVVKGGTYTIGKDKSEDKLIIK